MHKILLSTLILLCFPSLAQNVPIIAVKLNSADTLNVLRSKGYIGAVISSSQEITHLFSNFKLQVLGLSVNDINPAHVPLIYQHDLALLNASDIDLPGLYTASPMAKIFISKPLLKNGNEKHYLYTAMFLKAHGKGATSKCLTYDSLNFTLVQDGSAFKNFYQGVEIDLIEQKINYFGDEKRLISIDLKSTKHSKQFNFVYRDCQRFN